MNDATANDTAELKPEDYDRRFEALGEATVRAEVARGGDHAFDGNPAMRKAASEWLAGLERDRTIARGTPPKPSIVGPVIFAVLVVAGFLLVASF